MINARKTLTLKIGPRRIGYFTSELPKPIYSSESTYFALAYESENNVVANNCVFTNCRDVLTDAIRRNYLRKKMDYSSTNLIMFTCLDKDKLHRRMLMAKTLLNNIEKKNRWKRSKMYRINKIIGDSNTKILVSDHNAQAEYVVGSGCWVKNVYFFYAYVQILRAFIENGDLLKGVTTIDKFAETVGREGKVNMSHNYGINLWQELFRKRLSIFRGISTETMYRKNNISLPDGIENLCLGTAAIKRVKTRVAKELGVRNIT